MTASELFKQAYKGSYYTILGCGGNLADWKSGYEKLMEEVEIGKPKEWHQFTGKDMNDYYALTGNNRYPDDLVCLCFPLDGLDITTLAIFKIRMRDRWFDDIVDNNARREGREITED